MERGRWGSVGEKGEGKGRVGGRRGGVPAGTRLSSIDSGYPLSSVRKAVGPDQRVAMTGVPQAMDSTWGRPHPRRSERNK